MSGVYSFWHRNHKGNFACKQCSHELKKGDQTRPKRCPNPECKAFMGNPVHGSVGKTD